MRRWKETKSYVLMQESGEKDGVQGFPLMQHRLGVFSPSLPRTKISNVP